MPYTWTDPDVFISHGGVDVFNVYPDNCANDPPSECRFGFDPACADDCDDRVFDVDDVTPLLPVATRMACAGEAAALITVLIDAGYLTADGFVIDGKLHTDARSIRLAVAAMRGDGDA